MFEDRPIDYDTVEERYQKVKSCVHKFVAFQVGISCFRFDKNLKKYVCRPFNFFVFPKTKWIEMTMLFQAQAITFLSESRFDFNKLFSEAVSYYPVSKKEELKKQCEMQVKKTVPNMRSFTTLSNNHQKELKKMLKKIDDWVYDTNSKETLVFQVQSYALKKAL